MGSTTPTFPDPVPGVRYLAEGGQTTEIVHRHGFDLPHFALFPLVDDPAALVVLRRMYERYLDTAARHGFAVLVGGLDYRASPDWARRLGWSTERLADAQLRCIDFLREVTAPYRDQVPDVRVVGLVGPRGDAYRPAGAITEAEAEDYHSTQIATLAAAEVDLVSAQAFGSVDEAVGLARAAAAHGLASAVSFTLRDGRLTSGAPLRDALPEVDRRSGDARPAFFGINCSHPSEFAPLLDDGDWFLRVRSLRPNAVAADHAALAGLDHLEPGDPADLGRRLGELAARFPHLDIWGGCCGTWDEHLDHIARNVADSAVGSSG